LIKISNKRLNFHEFFLLNKLKNNKTIGGCCTTFDHVKRGIKKSELNLVKKAYKSLFKMQLIQQHAKRGGEPYFSLEPKIMKKIVELIKFNRCPRCFIYLQDLNSCSGYNCGWTYD
jgi:hypothetical protein